MKNVYTYTPSPGTVPVLCHCSNCCMVCRLPLCLSAYSPADHPPPGSAGLRGSLHWIVQGDLGFHMTRDHWHSTVGRGTCCLLGVGDRGNGTAGRGSHGVVEEGTDCVVAEVCSSHSVCGQVGLGPPPFRSWTVLSLVLSSLARSRVLQFYTCPETEM